MKKLLLIVLATLSFSALANDRDDPMGRNTGGITFQNMAADMSTHAANTNANTSALNGGDTSVKITNKRPLPNAPGMGASSSNTTSMNRKLHQTTVSVLFGGITSVTMDLDIVSFVASKPSEDEQLAACIDSSQFREFRRLKNNNCPNDK